MKFSSWVDMGLLLCAALVWGVVFTTRDVPSRGEMQAREHHLLRVFDEDRIQAISFSGEEQLRLVATHDEARFRLVEPVAASAELAAVDQLLRALRYATALRFLPPGDYVPARLGLAEPRWVINLEMAGAHYVLKLGGRAEAPAGARYLEMSGGDHPGVYVVSERLADELTLHAQDFRVRRLIAFDESDTKLVSVAQGDKTVRLEQPERNRWRFQAPFAGTLASRVALDRLFADLSRVQTADILELQKAERRQAQAGPLLVLTLEGDPAGPVVVHFGGACPDGADGVIAVRVSREPLALCSHAASLKALVQRPELFLDRRLTSLRLDEVETLRVENGSRRLVLVRSEKGFRMREPREGDVEFEAGQARLEGLVGASGDWLSEPPEGVGPEAMPARVTFVAPGMQGAAERSETVAFTSVQADGFIYAQRAADSAWLRLSASAARLLTADDALLRSRHLFTWAKGALSEVSIVAPHVEQTIRRTAAGAFRLELEPPAAVDVALGEELFDWLRNLEAEGWVQAKRGQGFGLEKPSARVVLVADGVRRELLVGARASEGGYYASVDGDGVFRLGKDALERLDSWVISRAGFGFEVAALRRLSIRAEGEVSPIVIENVGGELLQLQGRKLSQGGLLELVDSLAALQPLVAASVAGVQAHHGLAEPLLQVEAEVAIEDAGAERTEHLSYAIGAEDSYQSASVHYARRMSPAWRSVIFVLPRQAVREVLSRL